MDRISLDVRMRGTARLEHRVQILTGLSVPEFFDAVQAMTGKPVPGRDQVERDRRVLGLPADAPVCDLIVKSLRLDRDGSGPDVEQDQLMFNILVAPFYEIYQMTQREASPAEAAS